MALVGLAACDPPKDAGAPHTRAAQPANATTPPARPFTVLAGSELKDVAPALEQAARAAGVQLQLSYAGTLDMVERVNGGEAFDAILPPNGAYPALALAAKPVAREKLFYSRVALGVKPAVLQKLGWANAPPTWADIARAAAAGQLRYGMTNPTTSNTGMSALFAVASAAAGKTEDLSAQEIKSDVLKNFLKGQQLTAGSSGWLAEAFARDPSAVDALVNYEAVILRLNPQLPKDQQLALVYPRDGVITADYPLMLLKADQRAAFDALVAQIKAPAFQGEPLRQAFLRPANPDAQANPALPAGAVAELAFPNRLEVIDAVLMAYQSDLRRPATSIFVLDTSGSMRGQRLADMQQALKLLSGAQAGAASQRYAAFQARERVTLIPFWDTVGKPVHIAFTPDTLAQSRRQIADYADQLKADGGTAIYDALTQAARLARDDLRRDPDRFVSIVLLTDGENNRGRSFEQFAKDQRAQSPMVRVFPIMFGEAAPHEMEQLAELTHGRVFDARKTALAQVFKEIRGYQ
ncbi:substrate-binding domain-containing protein [Ottowia testudinis]|uniref:Substrate-binding domain-containing protein n=2 Tax=Ottowia testudinis TaxID=2816950 RepID=A0A975CLS2_9BURK|nr:substrate-binding domain-containing protein [Ottowia testudinis]